MIKSKRELMLAVIFILPLMSLTCSKKSKKSEKKVKPKPIAAKVLKKTILKKGYNWITADYRSLPQGLGQPVPIKDAPYTFIFNAKSKIKTVNGKNRDGLLIKTWEFVYDNKSGELLRISHMAHFDTPKSRLKFYKWNKMECSAFFNIHGNEIERKCWKSTEKDTIEEITYNLFNRPLKRRKLTIDKKKRVKIAHNYTLFGHLTSSESFETKNTKGEILNIYKKIDPLGAIAEWTQTTIDSNGNNRLLTSRYSDGSLKTETKYNFKGRYKATGQALTLEGNKFNLAVTLNNYGHRIVEKKYRGTLLIEEEKSHYDTIGRLVKRVKYNGSGTITALEQKEYNSSGLISKMHRYRGNIHSLQCWDNKTKANVSTKLPSLERSEIKYDTLGRVIKMDRFYLDQKVDSEKIVYGRKNLIVERQVYFGKNKIMNRSTYKYDKTGRIIHEAFFRGEKAMEMVKYHYGKGLLVKKEILKGDGTPPTPAEFPDGSVVNYSFDKKGRLIKESWNHADGTAALTTKSTGCVSCRTDKKKAVAQIMWSYNDKNILTNIKEYGLKNSLLYEAGYKYNKKGMVIYHSKDWKSEKKIQSVSTDYSKAGWISSVKMTIVENGKETYSEIRKFEKAQLLSLEKFKNGKLTKKVQRSFSNGMMTKRAVTIPPNESIIVKLKRNSNGSVTEEISLNSKGKPTLTKDTWNNRYTSSLATYSKAGLMEKLLYLNSIKKDKTESKFKYDKKGRQTGRKVFKNGVLKLEINEFFSNPLLAKYGIFTKQVRATIDKKAKRTVTSYTISVNSKDLMKSSAAVVLSNKPSIQLNSCICKRCGVTIGIGDFQ
jgi:hypothetical protein